MKSAQPSDITIKVINATKRSIDVFNHLDFALIEERHGKWMLGVANDPNNAYRQDFSAHQKSQY